MSGPSLSSGSLGCRIEISPSGKESRTKRIEAAGDDSGLVFANWLNRTKDKSMRRIVAEGAKSDGCMRDRLAREIGGSTRCGAPPARDRAYSHGRAPARW